MDRQGFIKFNTRFSTEKSGKASSYARAIAILDDVLQHQNEIVFSGKSLYEISDPDEIEKILDFVNREVGKLKNGKPNIFDYDKNIPQSYLLKSFCSAALNSLIEYSQFETAEIIVAEETNPHLISTKLMAHYDITKEGEDVIYEAKRRKGQNYFRFMVLDNYGSRCALTGIDIPELLLASHIIPWSDKKHKSDRLNPCNGICLSALYDKAFDKGLITFKDDLTALFSNKLEANVGKEYFKQYFEPIRNKKLITPRKYLPSPEFLEWHRDCIFSKE